PFGQGAFSVITQYWTTAERNTRVLWLDGPLLVNRAIWIGVAIALLALTYARFTMTTDVGPSRRRVRPRTPGATEATEDESSGRPGARSTVALPRPSFGTRAAVSQLWRQAAFEARGVVRSAPFIILLLMGTLNL